jgi:hypothetical protein
LRVNVLHPGDKEGLGKVLDVVTKGWLPYTTLWSQRVTEINPPHAFTIDVRGDFDGRGLWAFRQDGDDVLATFDWRFDADKPLVRYGSPLLKPQFTCNHRSIMARGRESLRLELRRRAATTPEERAAIPPPPGPTWPHRRRQSPSPVDPVAG